MGAGADFGFQPYYDLPASARISTKISSTLGSAIEEEWSKTGGMRTVAP